MQKDCQNQWWEILFTASLEIFCPYGEINQADYRYLADNPRPARDGIFLACEIMIKSSSRRNEMFIAMKSRSNPRPVRDGIFLAPRIQFIPRPVRDGMFLFVASLRDAEF
jgi:hypothetical protein